MASTRTKNTPGNYQMEKQQITNIFNNISYVDSVKAQNIHFPGDGLLPSRHANTELSNNSCDIESFLLGIGSTNLENPLPEVKPDINKLKSLHVIDKIPMILPQDLIVQPKQRPNIS